MRQHYFLLGVERIRSYNTIGGTTKFFFFLSFRRLMENIRHVFFLINFIKINRGHIDLKSRTTARLRRNDVAPPTTLAFTRFI